MRVLAGSSCLAGQSSPLSDCDLRKSVFMHLMFENANLAVCHRPVTTRLHYCSHRQFIGYDCSGEYFIIFIHVIGWKEKVAVFRET